MNKYFGTKLYFSKINFKLLDKYLLYIQTNQNATNQQNLHLQKSLIIQANIFVKHNEIFVKFVMHN